MNKCENYVKKSLVDLGFTVKKIAESNDNKTPDFDVCDEVNCYRIEVKEKLSSDEELIKRNENINDRNLHEVTSKIEYKNSIHKITEKAQKQLSFEDACKCFRLVWFHISSH